MALSIVKAEKPEAAEAPAGMISVDVIIQGDSVDELDSLKAKNMAFAERTKHGIGNAGISAISGPMAIDGKTGKPIPIDEMAKISEERRDDIKYQRIFRLTQGL